MIAYARLAIFSICILFSELCMPFNIPLYAQDAQLDLDQMAIIHEQKTMLENLSQGIYSFIAQIDSIIGHLAMLTSKHQIHQIKNQREAMTNLRILRKIVGGTLQDQAVISSIDDPALQAQIIYALLGLCEELIEHLSQALDTNLAQLSPFDLTKLQHRSMPTELSLDQLQDYTSYVAQSVEKLKEKADIAGLTWYNIWTRKFEKYVVDPCQRYNVPQITKLLLLSGTLGTLIMWKFGAYHTEDCERLYYKEKLDRDHYTQNNAQKEYLEAQKLIHQEIGDPKSAYRTQFTKPHANTQDDPKIGLGNFTSACYWLFDRFGHPYPHTTDGRIDQQLRAIDPNRYKFFAFADDFLTQTLSRSIPHMAILAGLTWATYSAAWGDEKHSSGIKGWLSKNGSLLWNFLRGGAYKENAIDQVWDFIPKVTFDDVVGLDEVKEALSFITRFIDNPEQYLRVHAAPERGYLLTGPTRTGKSFIVEALCGEIYHMLKRRGREHEFKFWKVEAALISEFGIKNILETAKDNAPIVLFIDEIDLLGLQRVGNNQLLSQFLTSMGNTLDNDPKKLVILIAATNKPETLDKALRQFGRLGKEIRFEYPSSRFRKEYLIRELNNMALDLSKFDLDALTQKTEGKSFEDLRALIRSATIRSWMRGQQLSQQLLEESLDSEIRHVILTDRKELPPHELEILSTYFAGQALASTLLDAGSSLDKVTVKAVMIDLKEEMQWEEFMQKEDQQKQPKIQYGRLFTKHLHDTINLDTYQQTINQIKILLAGFAAEELLLGSCSFKCHRENSDHALMLAESLAFEGINPRKLAKEQYRILAQKAYDLFKQCKQEVKQLLSAHPDVLQAIALGLKEQSTLTDAQIQEIINKIEHPETIPAAVPAI